MSATATRAASARQATGSSRSGTRGKRSGGSACQSGLVQRRVRAEREHDRHERAEPEHERQARPTRAPEEHEPGERQQRRQPAEIGELLEVAALAPPEEVERPGRPAVDGVERAAALRDRADDRQLPDRDRRRGGGDHRADSPRGRSPVRDTEPAGPRATVRADERVGEEERHGPEREVELARERDRRKRESCEHVPLPFPGEQRRGQQRGERPEQVLGALRHAIRRDCEDEPAHDRRPA